MEHEEIITKNLISNYLIQDKIQNIIIQFDEKNTKEKNENLEKILSALPENLQNDLKNIFSNITKELKEINKNMTKNDTEIASHFEINIPKKEKDMYIKLIKMKLI